MREQLRNILKKYMLYGNPSTDYRIEQCIDELLQLKDEEQQEDLKIESIIPVNILKEKRIVEALSTKSSSILDKLRNRK